MVSEKECLFCKIVRGEIPAKKVYEDDVSFAFLDINPRNPGHTLVIPKEHYETILDMPEGEAGEYFKSVKKVAALVKNGVNAQGLSISSSNGQAAGQVVSHQHFHVIPRFITEGPVGLEGILTTKRLDEKTMDQLVQAISNASPEASVSSLEGELDIEPDRPIIKSEPRPTRAAAPSRGAASPKQAARPTRQPERSSMSDMPKPTTGSSTRDFRPKKKSRKEELEELDEEINFDF